jgi:hypothetical protein
MARPTVIGCGALGGRSPRTGQPVGERHRWSGGAWGEGACIYCGRELEQVLRKQEAELTVAQALASNDAEVMEFEWHPTYWKGGHGSAAGWYVKRKSEVGGTEWLRNAAGVLVQTASKAEALLAIAGGAGNADS